MITSATPTYLHTEVCLVDVSGAFARWVEACSNFVSNLSRSCASSSYCAPALFLMLSRIDQKPAFRSCLLDFVDSRSYDRARHWGVTSAAHASGLHQQTWPQAMV